ncbi:hypothetical protein ACFV9C_43940 [Kribbella sp. NPDC059898]|uniref:hypothetical protein n=1 Tax=Kribbella sp. NPDC059898 TaxID=3346995 RepID=UPI00364CB4DF
MTAVAGGAMPNKRRGRKCRRGTNSTPCADARDTWVVQLWYGQLRISEQKGTPALTARYAECWQRRFPDLRITLRPLKLAPEVRP